MLFGTNFPMITATQALRDLGTLGLDDEARRVFFSGNAARVFRLPYPA